MALIYTRDIKAPDLYQLVYISQSRFDEVHPILDYSAILKFLQRRYRTRFLENRLTDFHKLFCS